MGGPPTGVFPDLGKVAGGAAPVRDHLWSEGVALVGRDTVIAVDSGDVSA